MSDASSDIFSRPIEIADYALVYGGAQKNLGPAGLTIVIMRDDMIAMQRQFEEILAGLVDEVKRGIASGARRPRGDE